MLSGMPSSRPSARTSSLNSSRNGSTSFMRIRSGSPPTLWCDLIVTDGPAGEADALDHVRIQRALRQIIGAAQLARLLLEHLDEQPADRLALHLRIGHAVQRIEEQIRRVAMHQADVEPVAERASPPPPPRPAAAARDRRRCRSADRRSPHGSAPRRPTNSTPPDSPQITRPCPTCARMRAISVARKPAMVQVPDSPARHG